MPIHPSVNPLFTQHVRRMVGERTSPLSLFDKLFSRGMYALAAVLFAALLANRVHPFFWVFLIASVLVAFSITAISASTRGLQAFSLPISEKHMAELKELGYQPQLESILQDYCLEMPLRYSDLVSPFGAESKFSSGS